MFWKSMTKFPPKLPVMSLCCHQCCWPMVKYQLMVGLKTKTLGCTYCHLSSCHPYLLCLQNPLWPLWAFKLLIIWTTSSSSSMRLMFPQNQGQKASSRNLLVCKNVHTYNSYFEHVLQNIHEAFVLYPLWENSHELSLHQSHVIWLLNDEL